MNIGMVIKNKRQKKNITQAELAELLSVTPQAVSRWEMGISYPDIALIPEISKILQVTADELLGMWIPAEELIDNLSGQRSEANSEKEKCLNQSQADSVFDYIPGSVSKEGRKVLVVDDSDFMRMMLENILTREGHKVLQASNGPECLEMLRKESVDVCVLDIMMPGMDGIETLKRIKEEQPEQRVIMLSAMVGESTIRRTRELGADAFVVKPFQEKCLIERIG